MQGQYYRAAQAVQWPLVRFLRKLAHRWRCFIMSQLQSHCAGFPLFLLGGPSADHTPAPTEDSALYVGLGRLKSHHFGATRDDSREEGREKHESPPPATSLTWASCAHYVRYLHQNRQDCSLIPGSPDDFTARGMPVVRAGR